MISIIAVPDLMTSSPNQETLHQDPASSSEFVINVEIAIDSVLVVARIAAINMKHYANIILNHYKISNGSCSSVRQILREQWALATPFSTRENTNKLEGIL